MPVICAIGVVSVLREPFRVKLLSAMVVKNVSKTVFGQEPDSVLQFLGKGRVVPVDDGIDVFLQQDFQQRTLGPAGSGTQGADDFRRQVSQYRHESVGVRREGVEKVEISFRPPVGREIRRVIVWTGSRIHGVGAKLYQRGVRTGPVDEDARVPTNSCRCAL